MDTPDPVMHDTVESTIFSMADIVRLNYNVNLIADCARNNSADRVSMLRALYTLKGHVEIRVRECLLWGRYLVDALGSMTSDADKENGMENRRIIAFDEVLRLTLVIDRVESMPYIKVINQSDTSVYFQGLQHK